MRHYYLLSILGLGIPFGFSGMVDAAEKPKTEHAPGLIATYASLPASDKAQNISQVVALPEFGLAADESPHPAIKPAFSAEFRGNPLSPPCIPPNPGFRDLPAKSKFLAVSSHVFRQTRVSATFPPKANS